MHEIGIANPAPKHPSIFFKSELLILKQVCVLSRAYSDIGAAVENSRRVYPAMEAILVSRTTGVRLGQWLRWLGARAAKVRTEEHIRVKA